MHIVTSGFKYIDIDAYAGIIAYNELLNLQGIESLAFSSAVWNESVTKSIRALGSFINTTYKPSKTDSSTFVDLSDFEHFEPSVNLDEVKEIIDHHTGFESYWKDRIGEKAQIEFIGSVCTLVYEKWVEAGLEDKMSKVSAKLLATGILENTLNFKATITDERDRKAYLILKSYAELPENWDEQYFREYQEDTLRDISKTIHNDLKKALFPNISGEVTIGQLIIWDIDDFLNNYLDKIRGIFSKVNDQWFMNLIDIHEGYSYIVCNNPEIQSWLASSFDIKFSNEVAKMDRPWLRKEIKKKLGALN